MRIEGLPKDAAGLTLEHNPNRVMYQSVADYYDHEMPEEWESDEHRRRAVDTNEVWVLRWYPQTAVGFVCFAAPTLAELCSFVTRAIAEDATSDTSSDQTA